MTIGTAHTHNEKCGHSSTQSSQVPPNLRSLANSTTDFKSHRLLENKNYNPDSAIGSDLDIIGDGETFVIDDLPVSGRELQ